MRRNREMLQQSSEKVTRDKNVFLFSHKRDTKVQAWPETPASLPCLPLSGNAQTSRRHVWRSPPPCLRTSADSLILSLHDSSVSWVCQPPALVSLSESQLLWEAVLPLRQRQNISSNATFAGADWDYWHHRDTHPEWTNTHTHLYTLTHTIHTRLRQKQANTQTLNPPALSNILPLFLSFFLLAASINQHKSSPCDDAILTDVTTKVAFSPYPLSSSSLPALQLCPRGTRDPPQPALSPEEANCLQQSWITMQWLQLRRYYWHRLQWHHSASGGSRIKEERRWRERTWGREEVRLCRTRADPLYSSMGFHWTAACAQAL